MTWTRYAVRVWRTRVPHDSSILPPSRTASSLALDAASPGSSSSTAVLVPVRAARVDEARRVYLARFLGVLAYMEAHLEEGDLSVERLSGVAAFSKHHFHRQFRALFGLGVYEVVQLTRLKRASYRLAFRDTPVIDIAFASGYDSHEAFSRAFKKLIGQTPSEFRKQPDWAGWHRVYEPLVAVRSLQMTSERLPRADEVRIVDFPETIVAALEHRGDPRGLGESVRRFIAWRRQSHLSPRESATFNIVYDNPVDTPPDAFRLDICAAAPKGVAPNTLGIVEKTIAGGRCAVLRHVGSDDALGQRVSYLYAEWLPQSGEEPRDFPLFFQRVRFYPDVPEHEAVTDLFLPIA